MAEDVKAVRSIGIIGQGGVGKTSLADALLFAAGVVNRKGNVDEENSQFDYEPEEQRRRSSLSTAVYSFPYKKHDITILDTPGYANFLPDGLSSLRACTGVVLVADGHPGEIRVEAEQAWKRARELGLPALAFVNRLDRENADMEAALDDMRQILGANPVAVQYPVGAGHDLKGVVDLLAMRLLTTGEDGKVKESAVPDDLQAEAEAAREHMIELAAEANDDFTERYLEEGTLTDEEVVEALRIGTLAGTLTPTFCGSAHTMAGVPTLLEAIVSELGSAADQERFIGKDPQIKEAVDRGVGDDEPFSAYVFKTIVDPFAGKLSVFRVISGRATSDEAVLNSTKDQKERLGHLLRLEGKKHTQVASALPGEVVAVAKLKHTDTGDTLCSDKAPIVYDGVNLPPPAISFAVRPAGKGDEEKAAQGLHRLTEEDPSLEMHRDPQTRDLILSGVGQLHIEVVIERLQRKFGAEVELKAPKIAYKETIRGKAEAQGRLKKQTGGRGQFADCWLRIEPLPRGGGFEFDDQIVGGAIPRGYIPAVEKGLRESMTEGILAGYPIVDIKATLYDGSYHDVDSSEMAFKIAASMGFKAAVEQAQPVLLEPVMSMVVTVPDDCMGDVIGDLNSRRGKVQSVDAKSGGQAINAQVPSSEVLKYASELRSMTSGRGSFTLAFSHYEELPSHLVDKVIAASKAADED